MHLLAEAILKADDLKRVPVECPEWPGTEGKLFVRMLASPERMTVFAPVMGDEHAEVERRKRLECRVAVFCLCDEKGERIFEDKEIEALARKCWIPLARIFDAADKLNGFSRDVEDALVKKSAPTTS